MKRLRYPGELAGEVLRRLADARAQVLDGFEEENRASYRAFQERSAPIPEESVLTQLLDTAFYASIAEEEGQSPTFSLIYADPELAAQSEWLRFEFDGYLPFAVESIRKLSPGVSPERVDIGVYPVAGDLVLWGLIYLRHEGPGTRAALLGLRVQSRQPGIIAVSDRGQQLLVFARGHAHFSGPSPISRMSLERTLSRAFDGQGGQAERYRSAERLLELAASALDRGVGATLLLCRSDSPPVGLAPPRYRSTVRSRGHLSTTLFGGERSHAIDAVGLLAGIDGAMVFDDSGQIVGAGAMITADSNEDFGVDLLDPTRGAESLIRDVKLSDFSGGARHRSALKWCYANPGAIALVVSHDGVLSLLVRPREEPNVLAIRPFRRGLL